MPSRRGEQGTQCRPARPRAPGSLSRGRGALTGRQLGGVQVGAGRGAQVGKRVDFGQEHPTLQGVGAGAAWGRRRRSRGPGCAYGWAKAGGGDAARLRRARKAEGESEDN